MENRINIFADVSSFLTLLDNDEFKNGKNLKCLIRQRSDIFLMIEEEDLENRWNDIENPFRKSCDAYDIPCPHALPELNRIFKYPELYYQLDPMGIWMMNDATDDDINKFREYFGVWMVNTSTLKDDGFYLHHKREYEKDDVIEGDSMNGWKNYISELASQNIEIPPINAIVLNDRYLIYSAKEEYAEQSIKWGLDNLRCLLDALLPKNLKIPFHLTISCRHPSLDVAKTDTIVSQFRKEVQCLRNYKIVVEFVYLNYSKHKRTFHSNYFLFDLDRGYNAFYAKAPNKLIGENAFSLESYFNDPYCSGDTNFITAKNKIMTIKKDCDDVFTSPDTSSSDQSLFKRCDLPLPEKIQNRLFYECNEKNLLHIIRYSFSCFL